MNRRGFLSSILATCAAPAIVRADALMRIRPRDESIWIGIDFAKPGSDTLVVVEQFTPERITLDVMRRRARSDAMKVFSASLFRQIERPSFWSDVRLSDEEIARIKAKPRPPLIINKIKAT